MPSGIRAATVKCLAPNQHTNDRLTCSGERALPFGITEERLSRHWHPTGVLLGRAAVGDESVINVGYLVKGDIPNDA